MGHGMSAETDDRLGGAVRASWRRFLDTYEPLRPDLYRYCRHLTRSAWDAEDMAQETLARAFVSLGLMTEPPRSPRAWLFRVASNLWINRTRQARELPAAFGAGRPEPATNAEPRATREAVGTLIAQLSPQERAAVVLKEAFGLSLEEIADSLSTTTGAIKAALHRGRAKLATPEPDETVPVAPAVLDAFCDAFNARDLDRLTALHGLPPTIRPRPASRELSATLGPCPRDMRRDPRPPSSPRGEATTHPLGSSAC
jgi:RNA polymerase sigma-70 factor (ECF subfamily)